MSPFWDDVHYDFHIFALGFYAFMFIPQLYVTNFDHEPSAVSFVLNISVLGILLKRFFVPNRIFGSWKLDFGFFPSDLLVAVACDYSVLAAGSLIDEYGCFVSDDWGPYSCQCKHPDNIGTCGCWTDADVARQRIIPSDCYVEDENGDQVCANDTCLGFEAYLE